MYRLLTSSEDVRYAVSMLQARPSVAVDLETTGKDPILDKVYLIGLDEYVIWAHAVPDWPKLLRALFVGRVPKIAHHWSFDGMFLQAQGIRPMRTVCTMVGAQLLKVGLPVDKGTYSLGNLVESCLGVALEKGGHGLSFIGRDLAEPPSVRDCEYLANDTGYLKPLANWIGGRIKAAGLEGTWKIENTYTQVLAMMQVAGTPFDAEMYKPVLVKAEADFKRLEAAVSEALTPPIMEVRLRKYTHARELRDVWDGEAAALKTAVEELNGKLEYANQKERRAAINSDYALWKGEHPAPVIPKMDPTPIKVTSQQQIKAALSELGLTVTDTKRDTLMRLKAVSPEALQPTLDTLAEFSRVSKLLSSYGWDMLERIHPDGRLHSNYQQIIATGRTSSSKWTDDARGVERGWNSQNAHPDAKRCVVAPHGRSFIVADYSQIELRVATELILRRDPLAKDALVLAFRDGRDPHSLTTAQFLALDYDLFHAKYLAGDVEAIRQRQGGKTTNFSWVFGISAIPLAVRIYADRDDHRPFGKGHVEEAKRFLDSVRKANPTLVKLLREYEQDALRQGWVQTLGGRRRHFVVPSRGGADWFATQGSIRRAAANMPIQGTAGDIFKLAGGLIYQGLGAREFIFNAVHDEFCVEVDEADAVEEAAFVNEQMKLAFEAVLTHVPFEAAVGVSTLWKH